MRYPIKGYGVRGKETAELSVFTPTFTTRGQTHTGTVHLPQSSHSRFVLLKKPFSLVKSFMVGMVNLPPREAPPRKHASHPALFYLGPPQRALT